MKHKSYIDSKAYRIRKDGSCLRVNGWYLDDSGRPADFSALINGRPARLTLKRRSRPDAAGRSARWNPPADCGFSIKVFPEDEAPVRQFELWAETQGGRVRLLKLNAGQLSRIADSHTLVCRLDSASVGDGQIELQGWADTCLAGEAVEFSLTDSRGQPVDFQLTRALREDI